MRRQQARPFTPADDAHDVASFLVFTAVALAALFAPWIATWRW